MMADKQDWTDIAAKAQTILVNSIPSEWRISPDRLPRDHELAVTDFPAKSGLLADSELKITESLAIDIVGRLAAGEWTAEEVTGAFCKRAAIAHQVVSSTMTVRTTSTSGSDGVTDQMPNGHHV